MRRSLRQYGLLLSSLFPGTLQLAAAVVLTYTSFNKDQLTSLKLPVSFQTGSCKVTDMRLSYLTADKNAPKKAKLYLPGKYS